MQAAGKGTEEVEREVEWGSEGGEKEQEDVLTVRGDVQKSLTGARYRADPPSTVRRTLHALNAVGDLKIRSSSLLLPPPPSHTCAFLPFFSDLPTFEDEGRKVCSSMLTFRHHHPRQRDLVLQTCQQSSTRLLSSPPSPPLPPPLGSHHPSSTALQDERHSPSRFPLRSRQQLLVRLGRVHLQHRDGLAEIRGDGSVVHADEHVAHLLQRVIAGGAEEKGRTGIGEVAGIARGGDRRGEGERQNG
eukprot:763461-Hanusia_phi.AAC.4